MIRVFVGTDPRMGPAERVLEHSIREHCSQPVEITWMRQGDPGFGDEWNRGPSFKLPYSRENWATGFSCFRFAVPELCGFKGTAVYLDADMIVLADLSEIVESISEHACLVPQTGRFDVIVWDCAKMQFVQGWPTIETMQKSGHKPAHYQHLLHRRALVSPCLSRLWDCCDVAPPDAKLVHYTNMHWQPWHPWPERFTYEPKHPDPRAHALWEKWLEKTNANPR